MASVIEKPKRLTKKRLAKLIDELMARLEIQYRVKEIVSTRFRGHDYEAGAAILIVHMIDPAKTYTAIGFDFSFYMFYWLKDLESYLNNGYGLILDINRRTQGLSDAEIGITKL